MGSVYARGRKLWIRFKGPDGKWTQSKSDYYVGQEREARELLDEVEERIAAGSKYQDGSQGPVTVERYAARWIKDRQRDVADWKTDELRLRLHILPNIGPLPVHLVRPRHIKAVVDVVKDAGRAPRTVRNVYSVLCAMFRDMMIEGLIRVSPCVLTVRHLGEIVDKDPEWRATAIFSRDELASLIYDLAIPWDRRVEYALKGLAAVRHGEAAGARWKHYDPTLEPLGRLIVAKSYRGRTKTKQTRFMPVHPALAVILAEWKLEGWPEMMGRTPTPEDLIVPMPPEDALRRVNAPNSEGMRSRNYSWKQLTKKDLPALGFRHRRGHDLRRTLISLAIGDGARKDLLNLCTHGPPKKEGIDAYITLGWEPLCAEVKKLNFKRPARTDDVVVLPSAVGGDVHPSDGSDNTGFATFLATSPENIEGSHEVSRCRDWDSNPDAGATRGEF